MSRILVHTILFLNGHCQEQSLYQIPHPLGKVYRELHNCVWVDLSQCVIELNQFPEIFSLIRGLGYRRGKRYGSCVHNRTDGIYNRRRIGIYLILLNTQPDVLGRYIPT